MASSDYIIRKAQKVAAEEQRNQLNYAAMIKQNAVTSWFEAQELKKSNPKAQEREETVLEDDLKVANYQLVKTRRERLRALYSEELQQWQQELKKKGLSIDRRTD